MGSNEASVPSLPLLLAVVEEAEAAAGVAVVALLYEGQLLLSELELFKGLCTMLCDDDDAGC